MLTVAEQGLQVKWFKQAAACPTISIAQAGQGMREFLKAIFVLMMVYLNNAEEDEDCPDYECPAKDGSFADPCTCRRFYQCVDFLPVKTFCPSGLWWDDVKYKL